MSFVSDKVALITGGASGIGLAIVKKLLESNVKGVTIVDFSEANWNEARPSLEAKYEDRILYVNADVSDSEDLKDAFEKTVQKFKNLDIVVNNAGIFDEDNWENMVNINLNGVIKGTYLALKEYLPKYNSGNEGLIVNTASVLGINTSQSMPVYCATKHAIIGFGESLAQQDVFQTSNIRLITFCPGLIETNIHHRYDKQTQDKMGLELLHKLVEKICRPDYVGSSVVKLMTEAKHGTVWVVEDELSPYEVVFPNKKDLARK